MANLGTQLPPAPAPEKKKNTTLIIVIVVVVILLCCCCVGAIYLLYRFGDQLLSLLDLTAAPVLALLA